MLKCLLTLFSCMCILATSSFAQKNICGSVYDALTRKPVSYAVVATRSAAVYCDSLGAFEIKTAVEDSVLISCVGYYTKRFKISLGICDTILLTPMIQQLEPVTVGNFPWDKTKLVQIGKLTGRSKFSVNVPSGLTFLKFFAHPDTTKDYVIGSISVRVNHSGDNYTPRKVRVRIFEAKSAKEIGADIFNASDVFMIDQVVDNIATIQLKKFFTEMPKKGCFVGLEFIKSGYDETNKDYIGFLAIKGWLSNSYEDGPVLTKYFSNTFREYTFASSQKVNLYCALNVYERK